MIANGLGHHAPEVEFDNVVAIRRLIVTAEVFYTWILAGTKISVLLMYARIFGLGDYFVRASSTWPCLDSSALRNQLQVYFCTLLEHAYSLSLPTQSLCCNKSRLI